MVNVREALLDDFENIPPLMKRNDMGFMSKSPEEWRHFWKNNPALVGRGSPWPIGWVLETDEKKIVGFLGNIPLAYELKNKRLIAASISSWVVDNDYRNSSMALIAKYFNQKDVDLLINATANNPTVVKIFSAFRARKVPVGSYDSVLFWIINYSGFVHCAIRRRQLPCARIMSAPIALVMRTVDIAAGRRGRPRKVQSNIRFTATFDERFDTLWNKLRSGADGLLCVRDSRSLDWHFEYAIRQNKLWICTAENNGNLVGYSLFLRQDNPEIGLRRVRLVDFQATDSKYDILGDFISCARERCLKENIDVLEAVGFNSGKQDALMRLSPRRRRLACSEFLYKAMDPSVAKELEKDALWDACFFDGDASL